MRKVHLVSELDGVAAASPEASRRPFADAVERENGGFLERRRKERARRVRFVMRCEDQPLLVPAVETTLHLSRQVELLRQPDGHGLEKRLEALGGIRQVRFEKALELQEWLVVEADVIELISRNPRCVEAIVDGVGREPLIVVLAREPLFLRGSD